jgi:hypothetical protein
MLKIEDPGYSFMLYLGPGPPSLLHLTRANATKPYAGDTPTHSSLPTKMGIIDPKTSSSHAGKLENVRKQINLLIL